MLFKVSSIILEFKRSCTKVEEHAGSIAVTNLESGIIKLSSNSHLISYVHFHLEKSMNSSLLLDPSYGLYGRVGAFLTLGGFQSKRRTTLNSNNREI